MRLHSYVVARDFGFAPNPFFGVCTLATCKPRLRSVAQIGDWIVGTGSQRRHRRNQVVYAMRVTDTKTFDQYWSDPRYRAKRPNLRGSKKQAFGDNIYHRNSAGIWQQENSHHSYPDGTCNPNNVRNDTQTDRVLIGEDFIYWGGDGPSVPARFLNYGPTHADLRVVRNHKNDFPPELVAEVIAWIREQPERGCVGIPLDWSRTP